MLYVLITVISKGYTNNRAVISKETSIRYFYYPWMKGCPGILTTVARRFPLNKLHLRGFCHEKHLSTIIRLPQLHRNERSGRLHAWPPLHSSSMRNKELGNSILVIGGGHIDRTLILYPVDRWCFSWENPFNPLPYTVICEYIDLLWTTETQLPHALAMTTLAWTQRVK